MQKKQKTQPLISLCVIGGSCQKKWISALTHLDTWGEESKHTYEIIAIPYKASDRLVDSLKRYSDLLSETRIHIVTTKQKGIAIQEGILDAQGLIRIYVPLEHANDIDHYEALEAVFRSGADMVILSEHEDTVSWQKKIFWNLFVFMTRCIPPRTYPTSIAYSQKAVLRIFPHTTCFSSAICAQSCVMAHQDNLRIKCVHTPRRTTKINQKITLQEWRELVLIWWEQKKKK